MPNDSAEVHWFGVCADAKARLKWNDVKRKFSGYRNIVNLKFLPRSNIPVICWLWSLPLWWMNFLSFNSNINTTAALTTMQDITENRKHYSYSVCVLLFLMWPPRFENPCAVVSVLCSPCIVSSACVMCAIGFLKTAHSKQPSVTGLLPDASLYQ